MKKIMNKNEIVMGAGAGVGIIVPEVLDRYVDINGAPVPTWGTWGKWSVLIPLISGAGLFLLGRYTKTFKGNMKKFTDYYSITTFINGVMRGIFTQPAPAASAARLGYAKTNAQRRATHLQRYGNTNLPPRGTGLYAQQYGMNPANLLASRTDMRSVRAAGWGSDPHSRYGTASQYARRQTHLPQSTIIA